MDVSGNPIYPWIAIVPENDEPRCLGDSENQTKTDKYFNKIWVV